jgi:hypothetical protein
MLLFYSFIELPFNIKNRLAAYPGLYVPRPIEFELDWGDDTPKQIGREILELIKMNWNTTQFDNGEPITLRASRQVGSRQNVQYFPRGSIL